MNPPEPPVKMASYLRGRLWMVAGVLLLTATAGCTSGSHPRAVNTAGSTTTSSAPSASVSTTAAGEDDDLGGAGAPTIAGPVVPTGSGGTTGSAACRSGQPLANVYHPNRLAVMKACVTVSGTVQSVRSEADGDTHFDLALDAGFSDLLKPANFSDQHGWLVAEIVPADKPGCTPGQPPRPPKGTYDYGECTGADEVAPLVGQHVYVTGPYVLDEDHGGWAEVHPVWAVSSQEQGPVVVGAPPTTQGPGATTTEAAAPPPANTSGPGVRIVSVTSPVKRGDPATLAARTSPDANCDLQVTLPSGAQSQSQGLGPGTADSSGSVRWTWRTGTRTSPGTATATVTCGSANATGQFQITS